MRHTLFPSACLEGNGAAVLARLELVKVQLGNVLERHRLPCRGVLLVLLNEGHDAREIKDGVAEVGPVGEKSGLPDGRAAVGLHDGIAKGLQRQRAVVKRQRPKHGVSRLCRLAAKPFASFLIGLVLVLRRRHFNKQSPSPAIQSSSLRFLTKRCAVRLRRSLLQEPRSVFDAVVRACSLVFSHFLASLASNSAKRSE